jgi:hypothetical protein
MHENILEAGKFGNVILQLIFFYYLCGKKNGNN